MNKTVIRFFTIADYEEEEIWLRKQHRSGWKLTGMTPPCIYRFESCEPEDVIYRLDFRNNERPEDYMQMMFTADEYVSYCGTHSDHIVIPEPYRTEFFEGLRKAALEAGDKVVFRDTYRLYLARKTGVPEEL